MAFVSLDRTMARSLSVSPVKSPLIALDNVAVPLARPAPPERAEFAAHFQGLTWRREVPLSEAEPTSFARRGAGVERRCLKLGVSQQS